MQLFIFSPSPSPASSPSSQLTPEAAPGNLPNLGVEYQRFVDSFLSIFILFPQALQQMGAESKVLRKNWCNLVVCCFFSWVSWCPGFWKLLGQGQGSSRQVAGAALVSGEAAGCHHQQGLASCLGRQTGRAFQGAPCDVALPAAGFTRHLGFAAAPFTELSQPPARQCDCHWGCFGDSKGASTLKWSCHECSRQSS